MQTCIAEQPGEHDCAIYPDWIEHNTLQSRFFSSQAALASIREVRPGQDPYDEIGLKTEIEGIVSQANGVAEQICNHACAVCPYVAEKHISAS